jgi:DNA-binding Lrp family transcriptional regulator
LGCLIGIFRHVLDINDRRIAAILQADNQRTVDEVAAEAGLSSSAAHRRIARLRRDGLIRSDVAVLDPKAFGLTLTFIVEITLEKVRVEEVSVMKARLKAAPEIQQIYNVTGEADLLLIVLARDVEHFEQLSRELFSADPLVRRYKTSLVVDRVKVSLAIPT